jgi:excisionase family DNA binding protein
MDKAVTRATVTVAEAARLLGIGRETAYQQARRGRLGPIPVLRIGRRFVVPRPALERALAGELGVPTGSEADGET